MADSDQILQELQSINKRLDEQGKDLQDVKQGQEKTTTILAQHTTAIEALGEGVEDIRKHMATQNGVDLAVGAAKIELKADNFTYFVSIAREVQSHKKRITALEERTGSPNPDKH